LAWIADVASRFTRHEESAYTADYLGMVVYHGADTMSEGVFGTLLEGGIVTPERPEQASAFPNPLRFIVARDQIRQVAATNFQDGPRFAQALRAFLVRATDFDRLSTERGPFTVAAELVPILDALSDAGFASKRDERYVWTDAMLPQMVSILAWTEAGQSNDSLDRARLHRLARDLPQSIKQQIGYVVALRGPSAASGYLMSFVDLNASEARDVVAILHPDSSSKR